MAKITIYAPRPADKALKTLCELLGKEDVEFVLSPGECKIISEQIHPLAKDAATKTTTIVGWPSCIKFLSEHTILWDSENAAQEEAWIQGAATALLGGEQLMPCMFCGCCANATGGRSVGIESTSGR